MKKAIKEQCTFKRKKYGAKLKQITFGTITLYILSPHLNLPIFCGKTNTGQNQLESSET